MLLKDLQTLLGTVYGIDIDVDVYDFLITDATMLSHWQRPDQSRQTEEKLLIQQHEDELGVALYLDAELLDRLVELDPRQQLSDGNLGDFCTALEGVSHFNYLAWNAAADKCVTLLELEMQAEVDKYISARVLLEQQPDSDICDDLLSRLFNDPRFHSELTSAELVRYQEASSLAGRYCRSLENRFALGRLAGPMIQELREFYRLTQPAKLSHIQSATFA